MGRVTLQTIADRLGVSRTTVSNAFSRPDQLSDELRDRIRRTAEELGYAGPDPVARSLRSGRVGAIGVLLTESLTFVLQDPYSTDFLTGVAEATEAADTGLLLVPLPPRREPGPAIRSAVVDGFVVFTLPDGHPAMDLVVARGLPTVTVDGPRIAGLPFVSIDERAAAAELARQVLDAGHRRILVLTFRLVDDERTGPVDDQRLAAATYEVSRERLAGVLQATEAAGLDRADVTILELGRNSSQLACEPTMRALSRPGRPTAVMAMTDSLALGALDAAERLGLAVPGDVSVTGYDDIPQAATAGLTTVRQSGADKGRRAARLLLDGAGPGDVRLPHELVRRRTLGSPP